MCIVVHCNAERLSLREYTLAHRVEGKHSDIYIEKAAVNASDWQWNHHDVNLKFPPLPSWDFNKFAKLEVTST